MLRTTLLITAAVLAAFALAGTAKADPGEGPNVQPAPTRGFVGPHDFPELKGGVGIMKLNSNTMRVRVAIRNFGYRDATGVDITGYLPAAFRYHRAPGATRITRDGMAHLKVTVPAGGRKVIGFRVRRNHKRVQCIQFKGAIRLGESINLNRRACWR